MPRPKPGSQDSRARSRRAWPRSLLWHPECRQPSVGIQGTCSALHSNPGPCTPASASPCVLQGLWPGDCKRKQNPDTWQSTCQISWRASREWKETPLQRRFSFNICMDCQGTNETFTILLYLFFLLLVLLQPQPSFGLLYLPNFDVCSFSKFTSASGHSARSFLLFFRI